LKGEVPRVAPLKTLARRAVLPTLSGILALIGIWLDQQFDASRGPVRSLSPEVVVWVSLAAVGLVSILWVIAWRIAIRGSGDGRS